MSFDLAATRNTLRCASDFLIVDKKMARTPALPQSWSKAKVSAWLRHHDGGRFENLAEPLSWLDGATLKQEWLADLVARAAVAGVSEADMTSVYEAFRTLA